MKEHYGKLFDYLQWRGDIIFEHSELNVVDSLIFATLSYVKFGNLNPCVAETSSGITLRELSKQAKSCEEDYIVWLLNKTDFREFVEEIGDLKRFRDVQVCNYVDWSDPSISLQFSAVTFLLPGNIALITFRGTDDSMSGWKENFLMSYMDETAGQKAAAEYATLIAKTYPDRFICIAGHSKGGNFAVYAGVKIDPAYRDRLITVFNYDGPGFSDKFISSSEYLETEHKILSFVPEASFVGVLLSHCEYLTVRCDSISLLQHDPFNWHILGKHFDYDLEPTRASRIIEQRIDDMVAELSPEEKYEVVEAIFKTLEKNKITKTDDLAKFRNLLSTFPAIIGKVTKLRGKRMKNHAIK